MDERTIRGWGALCVVALFAMGCGGRMPEDLGVTDARLGDCPASPNCVSSVAEDELHAIAPITIAGQPGAAWAALGEVVGATPRVAVLRSTPRYLHAVYTSRLMRYRDDVEFLLNEDEGEIEVRSASRVGYGDMGVNRARIEAIREALAVRGVARPATDD